MHVLLVVVVWWLLRRGKGVVSILQEEVWFTLSKLMLSLQFNNQIISQIYIFINQGTHCTGKTGKMTKKSPRQEKHREFEKFARTQGILYAQVVNC